MKSCVPEARNQTCSLSSQCWRPVTSLDYHQEEEYRASTRHQTQLKWYLCTSASLWEMTPCLFYVIEETALFLPIINKEKHTRPHCLMWVKKNALWKWVWFKIIMWTLCTISPLCRALEDAERFAGLVLQRFMEELSLLFILCVKPDKIGDD